MVDIIIGVVVLVVAFVIMKASRNNDKNTASGHGENFPFPEPVFDEMPEEEDWLGRVKDEVVIVEDRKVSANTMQQAALAREMAKVVQQPVSKVELGSRRKQDAEYAEFDFDVQKAIIYSEIMQPKYMQY